MTIVGIFGEKLVRIRKILAVGLVIIILSSLFAPVYGAGEENITVIEKLTAYLENAKVAIKPSSAAVYHRYIDSYIEPHFKDMPYIQLNSENIQELISNLTNTGLSAVTVQAVYSFIKAGLKPSGKDAMFDVTLPKYSCLFCPSTFYFCC